ncbi:MAG TPA: GNAT family N-acetyltransferase [Ktedonobacterales bacterium]|jgi:hypothetical protein
MPHGTYAATDDQLATLDLLLAARLATRVDRYPTLWRLELLLTTRLWDPERDAQVWLDNASAMIGFALLTSRQPNSDSYGLECIVHPTAPAAVLYAAMLDRATARASTLAQERATPITLGASAMRDQTALLAALAAHGFTLSSGDDGDQGNVYLARDLRAPLPVLAPPPGFTIQPFTDPAAIPAYHDLYGFAPVTDAHRRHLLASPDYHHIVAVTPDGTFAAYCECSHSRAEWARGAEPTGWIDYLGTRENEQGRGLGRAARLAGLHWLCAAGATRALLITMASNQRADRSAL